MPQDSVGGEDGDNCEYNQGGKDWTCLRTASALRILTAVSTTKAGCYMPQDSVGAEDVDS